MDVPHSYGPSHDSSRAGGAYVRRRLWFAGQSLGPGDTLTAEQVASIPLANLRALINTGRLELYPAGPGALPQERYAVHIGAGKYHVIEGRQLTAEPVTREAADAIVNRQPASSAPADDEAAARGATR